MMLRQQDADEAPSTATLFKLAMRRLASGVSLITTKHRGEAAGFIATSVTGLSAEPPSLLVCANRAVSAHETILRAGAFCVNLLGSKDSLIAAQFSSSSRRAERFTVGDWETTSCGALGLRSALGWFDCAVERTIEHHSHTIFIGAIKDIRLGGDEVPLVYFDQRYLQVANGAVDAD